MDDVERDALHDDLLPGYLEVEIKSDRKWVQKETTPLIMPIRRAVFDSMRRPYG
jgi:hypothetical protein